MKEPSTGFGFIDLFSGAGGFTQHLGTGLFKAFIRRIVADPRFEDIPEQQHGLRWRVQQMGAKGVEGMLQARPQMQVG